MTRAAVSIPSNTAEGSERGTHPTSSEFSTSPKVLRPSFAPQLYIAHRVGLISESEQQELTQKTKLIAAMLHNLIKNLPS